MEYTACHDCDLIVRIPFLRAGEKAYCPRCHHLLAATIKNGLEQATAFAFTALFCMVLANLFPFISFASQGRQQVMTLIQSVVSLYQQNNEILALLVMAFIILIPMAIVVALITILIPLITQHRKILYARRLGRMIFTLQSWCMPEVFLIGVLASLIKVASMATVELGLSFWAYVGFSIAFTLMFARLNRHQFWNTLVPLPDPDPGIATTAKAAHLASCHICGHLTHVEKRKCERCHSRLHMRTLNSQQITGALLLTAGFLYIPANFLPITSTVQLGRVMDSTILGGVVYLWEHHSYGVALIIFGASVLIPILKLLALSWLILGVARHDNHFPVERTRLFRIVEAIGRWSMVDVFVVAILVGLIQLGDILTFYPGTAALCFTGVVMITMLAAKAFDPRLIWDEIGEAS